MSDINLLPQKRIGLFSQERLLVGAKIAAVGSIILVVSLSILFFLLSRDPSIEGVKKQQAQVIAQLTILQNKTAKYLIIVDRVSKLKTIMKKRLNLDDTLSLLMQQIPQEVTLTNVAIDQKTISLSLSALDLSQLGQAIDNFSGLLAKKKILKTLTIQGLVSDEKGGLYVLTVTGDLL